MDSTTTKKIIPDNWNKMSCQEKLDWIDKNLTEVKRDE